MLFRPPRVQSNISASESNSATIPNQELAISRLGGGAVVVQAEVPNSSQYRRSNGSLHRMFACSAGGPGFDSRLRRINRVSQRTVASEQQILSDAIYRGCRWPWSSPYNANNTWATSNSIGTLETAGISHVLYRAVGESSVLQLH